MANPFLVGSSKDTKKESTSNPFLVGGKTVSSKNPAAKQQIADALKGLTIKKTTLPKRLSGGSFLTGTTAEGKKFPVKTDRIWTDKFKDELRGGSFDETNTEIDHIMSKAAGGTEDPSNAQPLKNKSDILTRAINHLTGKPNYNKTPGRQSGKYQIEDLAIEKYQRGEISLPEMRAAIANWDNNPEVFLHEPEVESMLDKYYQPGKAAEKVAGLPNFLNSVKNFFVKTVDNVLNTTDQDVIEAAKKGGKYDSKKFLKRTATNFASMGADTVKFASDYIGYKPGTQSAFTPARLLMPGGKENYKKLEDPIFNRWKAFYEDLDEKGVLPQDKLQEYTNGLLQRDYMANSKEWDEASFTDKMTKYLPETMYNLGPSLFASVTWMLANPTVGMGVLGGSVGEDVYEEAMANGVEREKALDLGLVTAVVTGVLERIIPEKAMAKDVARRFAGGFAKRLIKTMAGEATTEGLQELVQAAAQATFRDVGLSELGERVGLNMFAGAFGGGMFSMAGNIKTVLTEKGITDEDIAKIQNLDPTPKEEVKTVGSLEQEKITNLENEQEAIPVPPVPIEKYEADMAEQIDKSKVKTPFDTAEIIKAREEFKTLQETATINTPERKALRKKIADTLYGEGAKTKGRRIDIVLGPPASGKSSVIVNPLAEKHGSLVIDADRAKALLPEFQGGKGAGIVHSESGDIVEKNIFRRAMTNGDNIILPIVGKTQGKVEKLIDEAKAKGYEVHLSYVSISKKEAAKRAVARFLTTGRFVDPAYVLEEVGDKPRTVFEALKGNTNIKSFIAYDNMVEKGKSAKITSISKGHEVSKAIAKRAAELTKKNGGVTIKLNGDIPLEGFSTAISKETEKVIDGELTQEDIEKYIDDNLDILLHKNAHLGMWVDGGKTYLDVPWVLKDKAEAMKVARDADQLAIFDLKTFETIDIKKGEEQFTPEEEKEVAETLRKAKGLSMEDIVKEYPHINLKKDVPIKDIYGEKHTLEKGEALTPYELTKGKVLLKDGETYIVSKNQFQNIKGQSIKAEAREFAPELEEVEETILDATFDEGDIEERILNRADEIVSDRNNLYGFKDWLSANAEHEYSEDEVKAMYGDSPEYETFIEDTRDLAMERARDDVEEEEYYDEYEENTKYSQYQLPGGEDYEEILIHALEEEKTIYQPFREYYKNKEKYEKLAKKLEKLTGLPRGKIGRSEIEDAGGTAKMSSDWYSLMADFDKGPEFDTEKEAEKWIEKNWSSLESEEVKIQEKDKVIEGFTSAHWTLPNVIAHLRLNYRKYKNKKVTFMEEAQSDWAREARERGNVEANDYNDYKNKLFKKYKIDSKKTNAYNDLLEKITDAEDNKLDKLSKTTPTHPLLKDWLTLDIKRALQRAVETKSEWFAWTTGKQQQARYNLSKQVEKIEWANNEVSITPIGLEDIEVSYDKTGKVTHSTESSYVGKKLDEVIGKGIAEKIMAKKKGELTGIDLDIGGEWAINLYDKQVKNIVEDLTGGKVEEIDLGLTVEKEGEEPWQISTGEYTLGDELTVDNMKVGMSVGRHGEEARIITKVLGDGKFKAAEKARYEDIMKFEEDERIHYNNVLYPNRKVALNGISKEYDISTETTTQQAIKITPEIKARILGEAPKLKKPSGVAPLPTKEEIAKKIAEKKEVKKAEVVAKIEEKKSPLLEEAKKYKTADEFVESIKKGSKTKYDKELNRMVESNESGIEYITNYSTEGYEPMGKSTFYSKPGGGHEGEFGDIMKDGFVDTSKLYQGEESSWEFLKTRPEWKEYDPLIKKRTGLDNLYEVTEALLGSDKYYPRMNKEFSGNPNLAYAVLQQKAEKLLSKEGYAGAKWVAEDELVPLQYQIWDKSAVKTPKQMNEVWKQANKEKVAEKIVEKKVQATEAKEKAFSKHYERIKKDFGFSEEGVEFETMTEKEQKKKAYDFIQRNPEKALMMGYDLETIPEKYNQQIFRASLVASLMADGNTVVAEDIAKIASTEITKAAQTMAFSKVDLVGGEKLKIVRNITRDRLAKIGKDLGEVDVEKAVKKAEEHIKKETKKATKDVVASQSKISVDNMMAADEIITNLLC